MGADVSNESGGNSTDACFADIEWTITREHTGAGIAAVAATRQATAMDAPSGTGVSGTWL